MPPDETDEEREEKLSPDEQRPFTPIQPDSEYDTRPETDSNMDSTEVYQEGIADAAGIEEPNKGDTVVGYSGDDTADDTDDEDEE